MVLIEINCSHNNAKQVLVRALFGNKGSNGSGNISQQLIRPLYFHEGVNEVRFKKKLDSFTSEASKNHLIRNFLRNGRLRVKKISNPKKYFLLTVYYLKKIFLSYRQKMSLVNSNETCELNIASLHPSSLP